MKKLVLIMTILSSSLSMAGIIYQEHSILTPEMKQIVEQSLAQQCPIATERNWPMYEGQTQQIKVEDRSGELVDGISISLAVYGEDLYMEQPENGGIDIKAKFNADVKSPISIQSISGLCR